MLLVYLIYTALMLVLTFLFCLHLRRFVMLRIQKGAPLFLWTLPYLTLVIVSFFAHFLLLISLIGEVLG